MDKTHPAYLSFDFDVVKVLTVATWLYGTQSALVQMNAIFTSIQSKLRFSFIRMDSFLVAGYSAGREVNAKHCRCSSLERFSNASVVCSGFFSEPGAPHLSP